MARFLPTRSIRKGAGRSGRSNQTFFHGDKKEIFTVDLFCGAGGASTGLEEALKRKQMKHKGLAINHWAVAVDTMKRNHPDIDTKQMSIEEAVPADLVPGGEVDLLWASPSCTAPGGNDSGHIRPANKPIQTLTTCDNVQGVFPMLEDGRLIDIRIRMLKPSELAKAHSFPENYLLTGNRREQVKQIGNSVPVMTACAMCEADLEGVR